MANTTVATLPTPEAVQQALNQLSEASSRFLMMLSLADEDASAEIKRLFDAAYLATSRGLSEAQELIEEIDLGVERAKRRIETQEAIIATLERRRNMVAGHIFEVVEQTPGVVYRDENGQKVYTASNAQPVLEIDRPLGKKSVSDIIDNDNYYPPDVVETVTFIRLNRTKLREYLATHQLDWARLLPPGKHLRGLPKPKKG